MQQQLTLLLASPLLPFLHDASRYGFFHALGSLTCSLAGGAVFLQAVPSFFIACAKSVSRVRQMVFGKSLMDVFFADDGSGSVESSGKKVYYGSGGDSLVDIRDTSVRGASVGEGSTNAPLAGHGFGLGELGNIPGGAIWNAAFMASSLPFPAKVLTSLLWQAHLVDAILCSKLPAGAADLFGKEVNYPVTLAQLNRGRWYLIRWNGHWVRASFTMKRGSKIYFHLEDGSGVHVVDVEDIRRLN
jgi:hypothetical protein